MANPNQTIPTGPGTKVKDEYEVLINLSGLSSAGTPEWFSPVITTSVPEAGISLNTSSNWDAPFEAGAQGLSNITQFLTGGETTNQLKFFQQHLWQGSDPIEVGLDLEFTTHDDPYEDVVRPSLSLLLTALPRETESDGDESWTLKSPVIRGEESISITSNIFEFPFIIPTSVDTDFSQTLCSSPKGGAYPVSCSLNFSFITSEAPTRSDFGLNLSKPADATSVDSSDIDLGDFA